MKFIETQIITDSKYIRDDGFVLYDGYIVFDTCEIMCRFAYRNGIVDLVCGSKLDEEFISDFINEIKDDAVENIETNGELR